MPQPTTTGRPKLPAAVTNVRIPQDLETQLQAEMQRLRTTRAHVIRLALDCYFRLELAERPL